MVKTLPKAIHPERRKVKTAIEEDILLELNRRKLSVIESYSDVLRRVLGMGRP